MMIAMTAWVQRARSLLQLTRRQQALAGVAALILVVNLVLLFGYVGAEERRGAAQTQVSAVERQVNGMRRPEDIEALKRELSDVENQLAGSSSFFPKEIDSLAVYGLVANSARQTGVELSGMQNGAPTTEKFGANDYVAIRYAVTVRGQLGQVVAFLNKIETSGISTLIVNNQTYTFGANGWTAVVDIIAYAQKPA